MKRLIRIRSDGRSKIFGNESEGHRTLCDRALWLRHGAALPAVSAVPVTITCPEKTE